MNIAEDIKRKLFSTKFIQSIIVAVILLIVFIIIIVSKHFNDTIFGIWIAALLANFGIYTTGNLQSKKYKPEVVTDETPIVVV